jgi:hypothetical protein
MAVHLVGKETRVWRRGIRKRRKEREEKKEKKRKRRKEREEKKEKKRKRRKDTGLKTRHYNGWEARR